MTQVEPQVSQEFVDYTSDQTKRLKSQLAMDVDPDGSLRPHLWLESGWGWLIPGTWSPPPNGCRTYTATYQITFPDGTKTQDGTFPAAAANQNMNTAADTSYPCQNGAWHLSAFYGVEIKDVLGRWGSRIEVGHDLDFYVLADGALPPRVHIVPGHVQKVVNVSGAGTANGTAVDLWSWAGADQQKFSLEPVGDGYYKIVAKHSGKVLNVSGASKDNGGPVDQWDWAGVDQQKWRPESLGDGSYKIIAKHSGKALTVAGGDTADGTGMQQWEWSDVAHQKFQLRPLNDSSW
ncbi:RICIN domain-containing protein [Streptomyces luridiscabiei]|uniref:RICIN domain-containing protein n=1 Tax=Streptomyces luridiscabiei TaxID=164114 RepID=UPI0006E15C16|nr:RICIN domain-containing protein [Streptomyces luridiscabiei]